MIEKIIPADDKLKHFYLWTVLYFVLAFPLIIFLKDWLALCISLGVVVFTAAYKELVIDGLQGKGKKELLDFVFSALAPLLFTILYNLKYIYIIIK